MPEIKDVVKAAAGLVGTAAGTAVGVAAGAAAALVGERAGKRDKGTPSLDAKAEELYWREHFAAEPYYDGESRLLWQQAREAVRAAFERPA